MPLTRIKNGGNGDDKLFGHLKVNSSISFSLVIDVDSVSKFVHDVGNLEVT